MPQKKIESFYTYDDVLIKPNKSEILPAQTSLQTKFSRNIPMNIPIVSAAMDTVTESATAIVMAQEGGIELFIKISLRNCRREKLKKLRSMKQGMILDPITISPNLSLLEFKTLSAKYSITGFPVVDESNVLVGIITGRDIQFEEMIP